MPVRGRELHALHDATDAAPDGGRRGAGVYRRRGLEIATRTATASLRSRRPPRRRTSTVVRLAQTLGRRRASLDATPVPPALHWRCRSSTISAKTGVGCTLPPGLFFCPWSRIGLGWPLGTHLLSKRVGESDFDSCDASRSEGATAARGAPVHLGAQAMTPTSTSRCPRAGAAGRRRYRWPSGPANESRTGVTLGTGGASRAAFTS
ncbi:hypothetical protein SAMN02990966_01037 [Rhodospirillales bacterium URHD0017]|nr:hypothetical protein SAMN02990966_01037 [Rhodospirillales bacterium URHD0017]